MVYAAFIVLTNLQLINVEWYDCCFRDYYSG